MRNIDGGIWWQPAIVAVQRRRQPTDAAAPATLVRISSDLADLVDFHDADFSGPWFDTSDAKLHIGVATAAGREASSISAVY